MPAPSACSGLKELVECPGVMSTITCWAKTGVASISSTMPIFNRFNRLAQQRLSGLQIVCFMATELRQEEVSYSTSTRQVLCQELRETSSHADRSPGEASQEN